MVLVTINPAGELLMVRRPADGLLGGLWEFPAVEIGVGNATPTGGALRVGNSLNKRCRARLEDLGVQLSTRTLRFKVLPEVRHTFTHLKAVYHPILVVGVRSGGAKAIRSDGPVPDEHEGDHNSEHQWVLPDQVEHLPLPVAQRRILDLAWARR